MSEIVIESIVASGAKKAAPKAETKKPAAPKAQAAPKKETKAAAPKAEAAPSTDLSSKTVAELKEMAKAAGITGLSGMKKADLIAALSK